MSAASVAARAPDDSPLKTTELFMPTMARANSSGVMRPAGVSSVASWSWSTSSDCWAFSGVVPTYAERDPKSRSPR